MADLDHNLSLADALTEPPPEIEEEVKRDFIATLEAEKFDDVVGETVDKTDYVPLLDDDDAKSGSQEPKTKAHADGIQVEHTSASGPTVIENGDHGVEDHRTVFPGEIMDEKLSYKEFLDRHDSWTMDDGELCFESQPVFKPMEMADPFSMHRGDNLPDLSFPTDMKNVPLFTDHVDASRDIHAPHGSMMVPEQPFLGPLYSPAEVLDPSAFMGLDSTAEFLQDRAVPEGHWMGAQQDVKGPDTSFFVEPPVPPAATEAVRPPGPESPAAVAPAFIPPAVTASPGEAEATDGPKDVAADAACVPASDVTSVPAEKAGSILAEDTKPPQALDAVFAPAAGANPFQAVDVGFASVPEAKSPNAVTAAPAPVAGTGVTPAADAMSCYTTDLEFAPTEDAEFAPAAAAGSHHALDSEFAPAAVAGSHHALDSEFAPAADAGSHHALDSEFAPAADAASHQALDLEFAPAADAASHQALDLEFAPAADTKSHHALDSQFAPAADAEFTPAAEVNHHHTVDSEFAPVAEAKPLPAMDSGFASAEAKPVSVADTKVAASEELMTPESLEQDKSPINKPPAAPFAEATANLEQESKVPEACVEPLEKAKDSKPPPSHHEEHLPKETNHLPEPAVPAEAKEAVALEHKDLLPEKSAAAVDVAVTEKPKEEAEHNHVPHAEPQQEKALQEPTGQRTAQVRQANKSSERRFGRAKPAPLPITDVPEEHPVGLPQQKSADPKAEPSSVAELGYAAGTSPRSRVSHRKAAEQPSGVLSEFVESCRDLPRESWDLEGSLAIAKKKKKKPKQKRNQLPRAMEFWDENVTVSRAPRNFPFAAEWQDPGACPVMPAEARKGQSTASGSRVADMPKDAEVMIGSRILDERNASSAPAPAQQAPKPGVPLEEEMRDDGLVLQSRDKRKGVPLEQVGKAEVGEPVPAKGLSKPVEGDFPGKTEKKEYKESQRGGPTGSLSDAVNLSTAGTPLQPKPSASLLSHKGKEAKCTSPRREAFSDSVPHELQTPSASLEVVAKKTGGCEKSKEVENESFNQPSELPDEQKAAGRTRSVSSDKCVAVDFHTSEGALKTPTDTTKTPVTPLVLPKPEDVPALPSTKAAGFSEQPVLLSADSEAAKHPTSAEVLGRTVAADSPDKDSRKGFIALEQQTGKDLNSAQGMDRPRKKRGEGKVRKPKSCSEQLLLSEDVSKLTEGERADEAVKETAYPDKGRGFSARGHPSASVTHPYPTDKPKKRGSDGRSKRSERSFFQQPFVGDKMDPSSFPARSDNAMEAGVGEKGRETGCVTAECFEENTSHVIKMQRPIDQVTERSKENVGKSEVADLGALDQPFLLESGREEAKHLPAAATISKPTEVSLVSPGKEAGTAFAGESVGVNLDAALVADKPRKRSSDGKRKKPERSPLGPAAVLEAGVETSSLLSMEEMAGSTKEMTLSKDKVSGLEKELLLENQTGMTKEVLGKPEMEGGSRRSLSPQPNLSGHEIETSEPEIVNTKDTWPMNKGEEVGRSEALPEHRAQGPIRDKPKKKSRDVKGKTAENSLERSAVLGPSSIPAAGEEVGNSKPQSFGKGKETNCSSSVTVLGDLPDPAEVPAPAVPLGLEKSQASSKEKCKKMEANLPQPLPPEHKAEMFPPRGVEIPDKSEAEGPAPCSGGGGLPIPEHPAVADHASATGSDRSKKRGYDGSSKKAAKAPEQPVFLESKPKRSEAEAPVGSEMGYGMKDMDLVDENRNIKNLPMAPQMLWNNKGSTSESFAQSAVTGPGDSGSVSPGFPKQTDEGARSEGLSPPQAMAEGSSKEPTSGAKEIERQKPCEQPVSLGHKEVSKKDDPSKEAGSQGGSEAGKPHSLDRSVKRDVTSKKDKALLSPVAKVDDKEVRTTDKKRNTDSTSSDLPQRVADSTTRPAPVGAEGTEKREATISSGERAPGSPSPGRAAIPESKAEAAVSQVVAEALAENKAEEAGLDGGKKSEQSSGSLDSKAAEAEAAGVTLTAAQATKISPEEHSHGRAQAAEEDAARGGEAHPKDAPVLKSEVDQPQDTTKEKEEECEQKAVKEAKKERVKAAEQLKGYMRPTKARGGPALPARSAAPDRERQRQPKPPGTSRQRQEKGVCLRLSWQQ